MKNAATTPLFTASNSVLVQKKFQKSLESINEKILLLTLLACLLASCSTKDGAPPANLKLASLAPPPPALADIQRGGTKFLAYEYSLSIETDDASANILYEKLVAACKADTANECVVVDSNFSTERSTYARLKIRAKAEGTKVLMAIASQGGDVANQSMRIDDLSGPIVDTERRLVMLKQYQKKLVELEKKARSDVDSLIKISKELASSQSEIEQATGETARLMQRVNSEVLNVSISTREGRSFWRPIKDALNGFSGNFSSGISGVLMALA